ncbi:putative membrane protein [Escherichia coli 1-176-05_S3_C2]|nr:putative membrane protein [Escherichia coli 1-176-05_S3_C2]
MDQRVKVALVFFAMIIMVIVFFGFIFLVATFSALNYSRSI